jgi:hypothetical protein
MTFQRDKYQVLENAISYELANFCFNYFLLKRDAVKYMYDNNIIAENGLFGTWKDQKNMFDNWFKSLDEIHTYKYWKKEIIKFNKKTMQFWKDAFDDMFSNNKKED